MKHKPLIVRRTFKASPDQIWKALTDPEQMKDWYFNLPGFRAEIGYQFNFEGGPSPEKQYLHVCEITAVEPGKRLVYSWRYDGWAGCSFVEFTLLPKVNGQTMVSVTHRGLETFPSENQDFAASNFKGGWRHILGILLRDFLKKL